MVTVHTVDVSQHDWNRRGGNLDWPAVRNAGIVGMCARATYGDSIASYGDATIRWSRRRVNAPGPDGTPIEEVPVMGKAIPLSRGCVALVDEDDYERVVAAGPWHACPHGRTFYARRHFRRDGVRTTQNLQTFLTGWVETDHANGDGLDNRRANLRPATRSQNNANKQRHKNNTSGYKGVSWRKRTRQWQAYIGAGKGGKMIHLGYFTTAEAAARAYDAAAIVAWGEFARPNFPRTQEAA